MLISPSRHRLRSSLARRLLHSGSRTNLLQATSLECPAASCVNPCTGRGRGRRDGNRIHMAGLRDRVHNAGA
eukprot:6444007-Prymnesium_polylepis.1